MLTRAKCATDSDGSTPLHWAAANGRLDVCALLLDEVADADAADSFDTTPLSYAAHNGHVAICQLLLDAGAAVDKTGEARHWHSRSNQTMLRSARCWWPREQIPPRP